MNVKSDSAREQEMQTPWETHVARYTGEVQDDGTVLLRDTETGALNTFTVQPSGWIVPATHSIPTSAPVVEAIKRIRRLATSA